jgi:hypothetical protein
MATTYPAQYYDGVENVPGSFPPPRVRLDCWCFAFTISDRDPTAGRPRTWWYTFASPPWLDLFVPPSALIVTNPFLVPCGWGDCHANKGLLEPDQFETTASAHRNPRSHSIILRPAGLGRRSSSYFEIQFHGLPTPASSSVLGTVKFQGVELAGTLLDYPWRRNP